MFANNFVQFWFSQKAKHCCRHEKTMKSYRRSNSYIILGFPARKSSQLFCFKLDYSRRSRAFTVIEYEKKCLAEHYIYSTLQLNYTTSTLQYIYTPEHLYYIYTTSSLHVFYSTSTLQQFYYIILYLHLIYITSTLHIYCIHLHYIYTASTLHLYYIYTTYMLQHIYTQVHLYFILYMFSDYFIFGKRGLCIIGTLNLFI